jgi:hypothetical protein
MSRKIFVQSGGGGGGGSIAGIITSLPLISSASWAGTYSLALDSSGGCQLSANQFGYVEFGYNTGSNIIALQARPIQVSNSGVITLGSNSTVTNSSGSSISTTQFVSEPAPGRFAVIGRHYWSGTTYSIMSWGATFASNNTVTTGRNQGSDYSTGVSYAHPNSGNLVGVGNGSNLYLPGYTTNSYGTWNRYSYNGSSHYDYAAGTTVNSYSSTYYGFPALQHWSDTQERCGILSDHRDSSSGFYMIEAFSSSTPTNLGYSNTLLGDSNYSTVTGYRLVGGKAVYVNGNGRYLVTGGNGTVLAQAKALSRPTFASSSTYLGNQTTALGNDFFAQPTSSGNWVIFKVAVDGSNNATLTPKATLLSSSGLTPSASVSYQCWRLGGDQKQFLVLMGPGMVNVYDATALTALMV